jgi:hypothetical protein
MSKVDDLFNDFFENNGKRRDGGKKKKKTGRDQLPQELRDMLDGIINKMGGEVDDDNVGFGTGDPKGIQKNGELTEDSIHTDEDGNEIRKQTWEDENGSFTKISVKGLSPEDFFNMMKDKGEFGFPIDPFGNSDDDDLTLEEELELAIEEEDYELAAQIRDEITQRDKEEEFSDELNELRGQMRKALESGDYKEVAILLEKVNEVKKKIK